MYAVPLQSGKPGNECDGTEPGKVFNVCEVTDALPQTGETRGQV